MILRPSPCTAHWIFYLNLPACGTRFPIHKYTYRAGLDNIAVRPCLSDDRLNCQNGLHVDTSAVAYSRCGTSPRTTTVRIQELDKPLLFCRILFSRNNTERGEHEIEYGLGICNAMTNRSQCDERAPPPFQRSHLPTPATATLLSPSRCPRRTRGGDVSALLQRLP